MTSKCTRCGRAPAHDRRNCPARNAACRKCGKVGHYQVECRSKSVQEVEVSDTKTFLEKANSGVDPWRIELKLEGCQKIDTGAGSPKEPVAPDHSTTSKNVTAEITVGCVFSSQIA